MKNNILNLSNLNSEVSLINNTSGYDLIFLNEMMLNAEIGIYKKENVIICVDRLVTENAPLLSEATTPVISS